MTADLSRIPATAEIWLSMGVDPKQRDAITTRRTVVACPLLGGVTVWPASGRPGAVVYSQPTWLGSVDQPPAELPVADLIQLTATGPGGAVTDVTPESIAAADAFAKQALQIPGVAPACSGASSGWVTLLLPAIDPALLDRLAGAGVAASRPDVPGLPGAVSVVVDDNARLALEVISQSLAREQEEPA